MIVLYPAKCIKKHNFSGKLLIDGDLEDNFLFLRFLFDTEEMVHPLVISVKALPIASLKSCSDELNKQNIQTFNFEIGCNITDFNNPLMKTSLIYPDFLLKEHRIEVINIESQVSCQFCLNCKADN